LLPFFLSKQAAADSGIYINVNGRHAGGFKTNYAAAVRIPLFAGEIKMLTGKTVDVPCFLVIFISHNDSSGKSSIVLPPVSQAVQKGLAARHREERAAERTLEVREQREPKRNAADEPFSLAS
jgi:hypothetical protein